MLEIKQLKIFRTIVEVGSFTGAADQLGLSQPAISQQVRALESALGVALLVRAGRGARPTPAGELLVQCARDVLDRIERVERHFAEESGGGAGVVRVGAPDPVCAYVLPGSVEKMCRALPRIDVRVTSGHPTVTLARLAAAEIDVGLVPLPIESERLRVVEAGDDELVAITAPQHPWAMRTQVDAVAFADAPVVLYDRQSAITEAALRFLLESGVFPRVAVEVDQLESVKDLVRAGMGVAIVPRWSVRREIVAGALGACALGENGLRRRWALVFPDAPSRSATTASVVRLLEEDLPGRFTGL